MIIDYQKLNNVLPCKHCNKLPELIIKYYDNDDKSLIISCNNEKNNCLLDSYLEVKNSLEESIQEWNERNKK